MGLSHANIQEKSNMKLRNLVAALVAVVAVPVLAQSTPVIDKREANQDARIQQGVASGELTPRETARLDRGQAHVQTMEANAKADGVVTGKERAAITHAQNVQSRRIHRQKHDRQHQ
jgi:uncharacterized membrane protein YebE (DUF533 family)